MGQIYKPSTPVPAAAVVYAGNLSGYQHIVLTTQYDVKGYYNILKSEGKDKSLTVQQLQNVNDLKKQSTVLKWGIKSLQVSQVRDWSASTAMITLACPITSNDQPIPLLPDLSQIRGGNNPCLTVEDEIRIYAGYISSPTQTINADMLDDYGGFNENGALQHDPSKPLVPIFWGFIDKVDLIADPRTGFQYVLSCRDRARIFQDTKIISIPNFTGNLARDRTNYSETGVVEGRRDRILVQVLKAAMGDVPTGGTSSSCWKKILGPEEDPLAQLYTAYASDNHSRSLAVEDPSAWVRSATHKPMDYLSRPRVHVWVQRPPLVKSQGGGAVFQVVDKTPLEIVQFLAVTEERPTDFYCSHVNGDFVFGPRVLDTSGFNDELRSYRTYFFRGAPKGSTPNHNQVVLSMRATTSTLATYNRFVVIDSNTSGANSSTLSENVKVSLEVIPWILDGANRKVKAPCRNMIVFDGSLSTYENPTGGALVVGLAASRIWARDVTAIEMTVIGDPTLYPSEAVRVYNSILHDYSTLVQSGATGAKDKAIEDFNAKQSKRDAPGTSQGSQPIPQQSTKVEDLLRTDTIITNKEDLLLPVYKIRNISHKMVTQGRNAGYTSEISMVSDL